MYCLYTHKKQKTHKQRQRQQHTRPIAQIRLLKLMSNKWY